MNYQQGINYFFKFNGYAHFAKKKTIPHRKRIPNINNGKRHC